MDQARNMRIGALIAQAKALQRAMEHSVSEKNQEFARYESFKNFARRYNSLAQQAVPFLQHVVIVNTFDVDKMENPGNLTWPVQKQIFDSVFAEVLMLQAALEGQHDFAAAKTNELKDFLNRPCVVRYSRSRRSRRSSKIQSSNCLSGEDFVRALTMTGRQAE